MDRTEVRSLLPHINDSEQLHQRNVQTSYRHLICIPSKAASLIIVWAAVVGAMYYFVLSTVVIFIYTNALTVISVSA